MHRPALIGGFLAATLATQLSATPMEVPSGQVVHYHESFTGMLPDGQNVLRVRYVVPNLGASGAQYADLVDDFMHLCAEHGLGFKQDQQLQISQIVISFAQKETEFGVPNPDVTQYFEAFGIENDTCIWEGY